MDTTQACICLSVPYQGADSPVPENVNTCFPISSCSTIVGSTMKRFSLFAAVAAWFGRALAVCAVMVALISLDARAQLWNWARGAGGQSTSTAYYVYGYCSTVDNNRNVYVKGYFYSNATFGTTTIYAYGGSANYD